MKKIFLLAAVSTMILTGCNKTNTVNTSEEENLLDSLANAVSASVNATVEEATVEDTPAPTITALSPDFIDFEAKYDGKVQKLSDYVGKGKYVLVDFWASWCGPCRAEVPNLIKVYNKYKGDNFEVVGVATWDEPADTFKAIEEEGINYPQIINAQEAGSDAYGIEGIPEIILFAPDGSIVGRGLRGDAIEKAVMAALNK